MEGEGYLIFCAPIPNPTNLTNPTRNPTEMWGSREKFGLKHIAAPRGIFTLLRKVPYVIVVI